MNQKLISIFIDSHELINANNLFFELPKIEGYDFSTNVAMRLAKQVGKSPMDFAQEIIKNVLQNSIFEKVDLAKPGFINIKLKADWLCTGLDQVQKINNVNKEKILVDFSSPNIAKKMHIGHLRSTVIGDSLVRILKHFGHEVISDSHIGDWGTQFGKLIVAYNKWLDKEEYKKDPIAELQRVYVKFHDEENDELIKEAREILVKLQNKEEPYISLWKTFVDKSLQEYAKTYQKLNINFDYQLGESFYHDMMQTIVDKMMENNIAKTDDGAKVVYFEEKTKIPPAIIQKQDGGFLYTTSDMATIDYREKEFKIDKAIYVTDSRQNNHFKQVFKIAELMNYQQKLVHAPFGVMSLESGDISTRGGNTIDLSDLLKQGYKKALKVVEEKNPGLNQEEKANIATNVSIGAIKYFDLSHQRTSDIVFTWEKALSFNGNSAPYIQYTYTRISSLIKKAHLEPEFKNIKVNNDKEREIVKLLYQYGRILKTSLDKLEPHHIATYLFKLSSAFNSWYAEVKILADEQNLNSRLFIAKQVQNIIKEGLSLLGIDVLERM